MSMEIILQNAIALYGQGRLDEAAKAFRQILQMDAQSASAHYFLGLIGLDRSAFEDAVEHLYQALLFAPDNPDYLFSLAIALQKTGHLDEALACLHKLPDMAEAHNALGTIYQAQGKLDAAVEAYDKALSLAPNMVWATLNKTLIAHPLSAPETRQALKEALALSPDSATLWHTYGRALYEAGNPDAALVAYDKALALDRFLYAAYFDKGLACEKKGDLSAAEQAYRNVVRGDKMAAAAYHNLGALLHKMGRITEALDAYQQAVILAPQALDTCFNLALLLEDVGESAEAAGLYAYVIVNGHEPKAKEQLKKLIPKLAEQDADMAARYQQFLTK